MYKTILLPTDGSPLSERATATAVAFAKLNQAKLIALSVIHPFPFSPMADGSAVMDAKTFEREMEQQSRRYVARVEAAAKDAGIPFEGIVTLSFSPAEEIVSTASKHQCDLIMMASHGRRGLNKLFLGSETQKVLAHTTLPVMVLR